jgi:hypothetical protein
MVSSRSGFQLGEKVSENLCVSFGVGAHVRSNAMSLRGFRIEVYFMVLRVSLNLK